MTGDDSTGDDNQAKPGEYSALEQQFIGEYDDEPDEFDEELHNLVRTRERGSVLRPILMIIVVLLVGWVISDWSDELSYFFTSSDPVEVGDTADFAQKAAEDPDWEPPLEHNSFVSMQGMPTRIASGDAYTFFRLLGAEVYVQRETPREEDEDDDVSPLLEDQQSDLPQRNMGPGLPVDEQRTYYQGEGRLISFAANPDRVAGMKEFYAEKYDVRFCEDYTDHQIENLEQQRVEVFRDNWRERYEEADEQQRQDEELTPEPDQEDEQLMLQSNPVCVDAYMLVDDQRPMDHWWYLLFSVLLGAFAVYNVVKLVRWFRDWLKP